MPSTALETWITTRNAALDEIESAHRSVGGTGPGRRYATQQINQAYAMLLSSQFQGFCRELHTEFVDHFIGAIVPHTLHAPLWLEFMFARRLDKGNPSPGNIGADFNRLGIRFWDRVLVADPKCSDRKDRLEELNTWRNAIAHQDFDPAILGATTLQLSKVRQWRTACQALAGTFDEVMRVHLAAVTGSAPW
jgi:hypothetical protein